MNYLAGYYGTSFKKQLGGLLRLLYKPKNNKRMFHIAFTAALKAVGYYSIFNGTILQKTSKLAY